MFLDVCIGQDEDGYQVDSLSNLLEVFIQCVVHGRVRVRVRVRALGRFSWQ